ncbi:MAG: acyltransferase [Verrucomicrobia bacterium]|nr:acyltransferase [Verrucomicrobiota bacterium]
MKRLLWLDVTKGLAILWIVYFHFFSTYTKTPSPMDADFVSEVAGEHGWASFGASAHTLAKLAWCAVSQCGFHAVGLFIILNGWALAQATTRRAAQGPMAWGEWYRARFVRLYPMYWVAHLVYLVSPFVARLEPVDGRIVWSLLGLRFVDIGMNFMYLNAAWWYFAMLIQFYLLFPLFFAALQRLGPWKFLAAACGVGMVTRYLLLAVFQQSGLWVLGGCAICRLPEFALGMALGVWHSRAPERIERFLLGGAGLAAGLALYPAALLTYRGLIPYIFSDLATGVCCFLAVTGVAGLLSRLPRLAKVLALVGAFSYGIFLTHQPYVIWLGQRIEEQPVWAFLLCVVAALAVLSAWGILLEKATNALVDKLLPTKKKAPATQA